MKRTPEKASCAFRKDGGDDPDVTTGALIYAEAAYSEAPGINILGGEGVGRVTRPGLDQPVGEAAINKVPREMIIKEVGEIMSVYGCEGGLQLTVSVPGGEKIAEKTFNPRLGFSC